LHSTKNRDAHPNPRRTIISRARRGERAKAKVGRLII
jgi:hypothetical protein